MSTVDLSNCAREPIHVPGSIQAHALMLVLSEPDWVVTHASHNADDALGGGKAVRGRALAEILSPAQVARWRAESAGQNIDQTPLYLTALPESDAAGWEVLLHRHDGALIMEFERWGEDGALSGIPAYARLQRTLAELNRATSVADYAQRAAESVRGLIGFDRVMVYRFAEDDSGHVIAESRREDLESYLGLHYPASDIPSQARELFRRSPVRLNPDIHYTPIPLVPGRHETDGRPVDMSFCVTRSMSPIHVEYLSNMGVAASMSLSIVVEGRLWGLLACHHDTPRYVRHDARMACEFITQVLSLQMADKERGEQAAYAQRLSEDGAELMTRLRATPDLMVALRQETAVMGGIEAVGSALLLDDAVLAMGRVPDDDAVRALGAWVSEHRAESVNATSRLADWDETLGDRMLPFSGVLMARLSRRPAAYLCWFRQPEVFSVNWAGNPRKPVETGPNGDRLTPRKSFALWQEEVRDRARPWLPVERDAARDLRHGVLESMMRRTEPLVRLQVELEKRNQDLDSFAYIASHDLKEPLRGMRNYARYLVEDHAAELAEEAREKIATIERLGQRMELLLDALLHYSRVGRTEMVQQRVDLNHVVAEAKDVLIARLEERPVTIRVPRPLPVVRGDASLLTEIFANLISNAIKYNDKPERWVEIGWSEPETADDGPQFYVRDNGIGIAADNHRLIFRIFKRLHAREAFGGGAGAGLTVVRSILTRSGGDVWLESEPGAGTTFFFKLGAPAVAAGAANDLMPASRSD